MARLSPEDTDVMRQRMKADVEKTLSAFVDKDRGGTPLLSDGARLLIDALFSESAIDARN